MKNAVSLLLCFVLLFTFCGCSSGKKSESNVKIYSSSAEAEIKSLEKLYEGRNVFYGEMHDHSDSGGTDGHFGYPQFTRARFEELVSAVKENGGYFVLPHPMATSDCIPASDDPDCFWYGDYTGLEVLYQSIDGRYTNDCYQLWRKLLEKGRRIYACAGGDGHNKPDNYALTTVYAEEKNAASILSVAKSGDATAGGVGIRMAVGDTVTGGHTRFADNEKLIIAVGDFQRFAFRNNIKYNVRIYKNEEIIADLPVSTAKTNYFTVNLDNKADYYRAVVYEANGVSKTIIAYGNPIWNDKDA